MTSRQSLFIASTGQNVGKTTLSLGLFQILRRRFSSVGFFKPVGQRHVTLANGDIVDKDAALFSACFSLHDLPHDVSPVICDSGFTRRFLDKNIRIDDLENEIVQTYDSVSSKHSFVLVEGTGHMGVGSIFSLNNARVASLLRTPVVIIATGGLGSSFDELALNISLAKEHGVDIRGVILNKVLSDKRAMIEKYFPKALSRWNIPLIGMIPYVPSLSFPTMKDFSLLFDRPLVSGKGEEVRHLNELRLVAGSLESFLQEYSEGQVIITPACRDDIILACVERRMREQFLHNRDFSTGLLLTGAQEPKSETIQKLDVANIPALWVPEGSFDVMKAVSTFTAKIQKEDEEKIQQAIDLVEQYVDFDTLLQAPLPSYST